MKVVVVGGGIAGLCCAYYLRKRDVDVTLVDRDHVGARTASSWGNGAGSRRRKPGRSRSRG